MTSRTMIRILAAAVARPEWGRAMLAELDGISSSRGRREFALGCIQALVVSLPAAAATAFASGLLSLVLMLAVLIRYPDIVTGPGTWVAVSLFVCIVISYAVAAAGLAVRMVDYRLAAGAALGAAGIACAWLAVGFSAAFAFPAGIPEVLLGLGFVVALAVGWWAARSASSPETGFQCAGLASLLAGITLFLLWAGEALIFAGRPYDAGMLRDFRSSGVPDLATYAVSDSLGTGMMLMLLVPLVSVLAGVTGAVAGASRWPTRESR